MLNEIKELLCLLFRDASDVNHEPEPDVINCVKDADDNKIYNGVVITQAGSIFIIDHF